jgi:hypothetical protein
MTSRCTEPSLYPISGVFLRDEPGVGHGVLDAERAGTVVTDRGVVAHRLVELVVVALLVFQLRDPLCPGAVEDDLDLVALGLGELLRGLQPVREATVVGVRFVAGEDHDCGFCHCAPL